MRTYEWAPLFRTSVGFDRVSRMMDAALELQRGEETYPPYDIVKHGDADYTITVALAGFDPSDVEVEVEKNVLTVSSAGRVDEADATYLYRGIAKRQFLKRFHLADHVQVKSARMDQGLLHIELEQVIPEALKPRKIEVSNVAQIAAAAK